LLLIDQVLELGTMKVLAYHQKYNINKYLNFEVGEKRQQKGTWN
jgi:hypothetical protein